MTEMKATTLLGIVGAGLILLALYLFIASLPEFKRYLKVQSMK